MADERLSGSQFFKAYIIADIRSRVKELVHGGARYTCDPIIIHVLHFSLAYQVLQSSDLVELLVHVRV